MVYKYCSSSFNPLSLPAPRFKSGSKQSLAAFASIFLFRTRAKGSFPIERLLSCVFPINPLISSYGAGLCPELSNFQEQPENAIHCVLFKNGEGILRGFLHSFVFYSRGAYWKYCWGKYQMKSGSDERVGRWPIQTNHPVHQAGIVIWGQCGNCVLMAVTL